MSEHLATPCGSDACREGARQRAQVVGQVERGGAAHRFAACAAPTGEARDRAWRRSYLWKNSGLWDAREVIR
jgi:hypothetical protein